MNQYGTGQNQGVGKVKANSITSFAFLIDNFESSKIPPSIPGHVPTSTHAIEAECTARIPYCEF